MNKVMIALLAGFVAGILLAPDKGSVTRKKLNDGVDDFADKVNGLKDKVNGLKERFSSLKNKLSSEVDSLTEGVRSAPDMNDAM